MTTTTPTRFKSPSPTAARVFDPVKVQLNGMSWPVCISIHSPLNQARADAAMLLGLIDRLAALNACALTA